jgi:uncharacterized coiled-coil protein SlyX
MFGKTTVVNVEDIRNSIDQEIGRKYREQEERLVAIHEMDVKEIRKDHELEIKGLKFDMERATEQETADLKKEVTELEQKLAVAENTIEMMDELTELQTGMLDVKEVVSSLIKKLPTIDIKSITAGSSSKD